MQVTGLRGGVARTGHTVRFGTSGVRGVVSEDLTQAGCRCVGMALGTVLGKGARVCLGRDTRISGPVVSGWFRRGLLAAGADVVDLGVVPTPVLAALTRAGGYSAGAMVTASHNPPEYKGIKLFDADGIGFSREQEAAVEGLCREGRFSGGASRLEREDRALELYLECIPSGLAATAAASGIPLLVDPGNGAACGFVCEVYERLGLRVESVNDVPDGRFPGRGPEPGPGTLDATVAALEGAGAELAVCFDGDADRVLFCDREGFLGLDEMVAFIARNRVRQTGKRCLATTVETGLLPEYAVAAEGGQVVRGEVGDAAVARLARQEDAALGAETVGVYIFPELGFYPESILAPLYLLGMLGQVSDIREFINSLPPVHLVNRKVRCPSRLKTEVMRWLGGSPHDMVRSGNVRVNRTDGLRLELGDAWLLVRPSGTEPVIRVTAESTSAADAEMVAGDARARVEELVAMVERLGLSGDAS